jgi:hypothetical protein
MSEPAAHKAVRHKYLEQPNGLPWTKSTNHRKNYKDYSTQINSVKQKYQWNRIITTRNYIIGTIVCKKSKYITSSTYLYQESPTGTRKLLPTTHSTTNCGNISTHKEVANSNKSWIICLRNFVPKSRRRT